MTASLVGFAAIGTSLLVSEMFKLSKTQQKELKLIANIFAETSAAYLLFGDENGARNILNSLRSNQEITRAVLFDRNKNSFVSYSRDGAEEAKIYEELKQVAERFGINRYWKEIMVDGEIAGHVYIEADDIQVREFVIESIVVIILNVSIGIFIVYVIASRMQKIISEPIEHLTETASEISEKKDYGLRAEKQSGDEIGVLTDEFNYMLSQLQLSNNELLESENRFKQVVEQSVDVLFIVNTEGVIIDVNNAACKVLGYDRDELTSIEWSKVDSRFEDELVLKTLMERLKDDHRLLLESEYTKKNGENFPVEISISFVNVDKQRYLLVSARDNTERKIAEKKLKQANDQLEEKVNERTRELKNANMALSRSKEKAEAASRAKSMFLANMSHEIRTPMNAVIGFTDVLSSSGLNEKQAAYVESIQSGSRNLLSLINDILDISKIEAGKMKVEFDRVYIRQLLEDIKSVFSIAAREKALYLNLVIDEDVPVVIMSDEVRLRQILFNLVNNAIKFTRKGGVEIHARMLDVGKDGLFSDFAIEVKDSGIGIRVKDQKKIFNIFEQQDSQSTREFGGAGLGLAISTRLAERLNSEIMLQSKIGEGSCFTLLMKSPEIADDSKLKQVKSVSSGISLRPARILIADDIEENRNLICEYLSGQPVEVLHASDGAQAIEVLERDKPDLILMDIRMPVMSGVEATQKIKSNPALASTLVVAVTASVVEDEKADKKRSLFDAILYKPLNRNALMKTLSGLLPVEQDVIEAEADASNQVSLLNEMKDASEKFVEEITVYAPILERAKKRGSFGGLNQLLDELLEIAVQYKMHEFEKMVENIRVANDQFDIEETQRMITLILAGINKLQDAVS